MRERVGFRPVRLDAVPALPYDPARRPLHTMSSPESRAPVFYTSSEAGPPIPRIVMEVRNTKSPLNTA